MGGGCLVLLGVLIWGGCTPVDEVRLPDPTSVESSDTRIDAPTWHDDVEPVLREHCSECHRDNGINADIVFDTYERAAPLAPMIAGVTASGEMPPFLVAETDTCEPPFGWKDDIRLTSDEIDMLAAWAAADAPEGTPPGDAPATMPSNSRRLDGWNEELVPTVPVELEGAGEGITDVTLCWSFDLANDEEAWLDGLEVVPDNDRVVHHVRIDIDPDASSGENDEEWYECEGTAYGDRAGVWVPGAAPTEVPSGSGLRIPAGSRLVMLVHYHLVDTDEVDQTAIRVRWLDEPPELEARFLKVDNFRWQRPDGTGLQPGPNDGGREPRLFVPAGVRGHTETMLVRIEDDLPDTRIFLVGHHMHYAGVSAELRLERPFADEGESWNDCLLRVEPWDFEYQMFYQYDDPTEEFLALDQGDIFRLVCTYDNTVDNEHLMEHLAGEGLDAPVALGDDGSTLSEMCASLVGVVGPADY